MTFDEIGQCWVAEADDPMEGWTVLHREPFKDGVERVHVRAVAIPPAQFRIVYQRTANTSSNGDRLEKI